MKLGGGDRDGPVRGGSPDGGDAPWLEKALRDGPLLEIVAALNSGADPNEQDVSGWSPLHYAAVHGYTLIARVLLSHGADPNVQTGQSHPTPRGRTPLHYAMERCLPEMIDCLLMGGARLDIRDDDGQTPVDVLYDVVAAGALHPNSYSLPRAQMCFDILMRWVALHMATHQPH